MHGPAHNVVAAERERQVAHAAADLNAGAALLDLAGGLEEGHGVAVMLLDARGDGKDVGVEDDVLGRHVGPLHEQPVRPLADAHLALDRVGLALLVEGHHHHRGAVTAREAGLGEEVLLALLHADRVDHRLALNAAQARLDNRPLGAVDHDRHLGDVRLGGDHVEERGHGRLGVEHGLVHVHVDHVGAAAHLLGGHLEGGREVVGQDQLGEAPRPGHVGALAHHEEVRVRTQDERLKAGEARQGLLHRHPARSLALGGLGDRPDVRGGRPAAASEDVDEPAGGELAQLAGRLVGALVILAEGVRQAGVGVAAGPA